jgi:putative transposon-encoded protein
VKGPNAFEDDSGSGGDPRVRAGTAAALLSGEVQFSLYGEEVVQKTVTASGTCGRVYLPLGWVGKRVKIIRVD